MQHPSFY